MTVGVVCVVAGLGSVVEVAVRLTDWDPEDPEVILPEGTVTLNIPRSPIEVPAATVVPVIGVVRPTVVVLAATFLVIEAIVWGLPPITITLPTGKLDPFTSVLSGLPS